MDRRTLVTPRNTAMALIGGAAVFVLLMSACGSPSNAAPAHTGGSPSITMSTQASAGPSGSMSMQMSGGSAATGGPAASTDQVQITNFAFAPAEISVVAGTTVTWTNEDAIQHTVHAPQLGLNSPPLNQGDTYTHAFSKPGTYHYICSIHPFMHGTVVVTAK